MPDPEPEELELLPDDFGLERGLASSSAALVIRLAEEFEEALDDESADFEDVSEDLDEVRDSESGLDVLVFFGAELSSSVAGVALSVE